MGDFRKKVEKKAAENPALQFFSQAEEQAEEPPRNRLQIETRPPYQRKSREFKSRRLQLLLRPSLHDALKERADNEDISVNELVNSLLEAAMEGSEKE